MNYSSMFIPLTYLLQVSCIQSNRHCPGTGSSSSGKYSTSNLLCRMNSRLISTYSQNCLVMSAPQETSSKLKNDFSLSSTSHAVSYPSLSFLYFWYGLKKRTQCFAKCRISFCAKSCLVIIGYAYLIDMFLLISSLQIAI